MQAERTNWLKVRWEVDGWVMEGNDRDGYRSQRPDGRTVVAYGNSLASTKRLTDEARIGDGATSDPT